MVLKMDDFEPEEFYDLQKSLETPAHISCLTFGHAGHLFAGSGEHQVNLTLWFGNLPKSAR